MSYHQLSKPCPGCCQGRCWKCNNHCLELVDGYKCPRCGINQIEFRKGSDNGKSVIVINPECLIMTCELNEETPLNHNHNKRSLHIMTKEEIYYEMEMNLKSIIKYFEKIKNGDEEERKTVLKSNVLNDYISTSRLDNIDTFLKFFENEIKPNETIKNHISLILNNYIPRTKNELKLIKDCVENERIFDYYLALSELENFINEMHLIMDYILVFGF